DGIRDFHVTGVQTCALPISNTLPVAIGALASAMLAAYVIAGGGMAADAVGGVLAMAVPSIAIAFIAVSVGRHFRRAHTLSARIRSEERRVGKACGAPCWRD